MSTQSELCTKIYETADKEGLSLEQAGILDEDDLTIFALRFLLANLSDAVFIGEDDLVLDEEEGDDDGYLDEVLWEDIDSMMNLD